MSNLQADTVTCLRFDSVKSWGCHRCSFLGDKHQDKSVRKHNSHSEMGKTLSADDDKSQRKRNNRRQQVNFTLFRSSGR
ncbi:hypothetical protein B4U22_33660 [Klebsiella pneumoniae]|nr:hypothetical protein B4U22_33660 [Klebsiella pneumoniae]OWG01417.1 hypothetical protein B4U21_32750 [Klebsiella pneumoniae]